MRLIILFAIGILLIMVGIRSGPNGEGTIGSMIGALLVPQAMKETTEGSGQQPR